MPNMRTGSSNRTFMELKSLTTIVSIGTTEGSNRTFMELKSRFYSASTRADSVLIAPLWNWNTTTAKICEYVSQSSNRTFMELKSSRRDYLLATDGGSNRTFMELK